jgi:hypothetical protein
MLAALKKATDGQSISKSWCRAPSVAHEQIFITLWQLRSCFCGAPSLTRGRVCLSYMLLAPASVVFLGFMSLRTRDLDLRLPFTSPPTTRRVTVEVFYHASTRVGRVCRRRNHMATDGQSVSHGVQPQIYYCLTVTILSSRREPHIKQSVYCCAIIALICVYRSVT